MEKINIVWLKRDLRTQDHMPLHLAESDALPYIVIYIFEPELLNRPDTGIRHLQFIYNSLSHLEKHFKAYSIPFYVFKADAVEVFSYIHSVFDVQNVFSHEEHGTVQTWERDNRIKTILAQKETRWLECQSDFVLRGISNRKDWDRQWYIRASENTIKNKYKNAVELQPLDKLQIDHEPESDMTKYPDSFQAAGEKKAFEYLESFMAGRGMNYMKHISKPLQSRKSCSRISPYLAWGNISIKQAYQFVKSHPVYSTNKRAFSAMLTRLKWRSHFIQKFEVECDYEFRCINRGYEEMPYSDNDVFLNAWKTGNTGYPLVDACMRCLIKTGWINFRMRAMLVSFLCHQLDINWKHGAPYLASLFLDYEPGIHYPQFQMQAGTTGVNTIRMYNPVKQSYDHDPEGVFIKEWIPELSNVPVAYIHEPWKMTEMEQRFIGLELGRDYPKPVVEITEASKKARDKIWSFRKHPKVRRESQRILATHTRRSS